MIIIEKIENCLQYLFPFAEIIIYEEKFVFCCIKTSVPYKGQTPLQSHDLIYIPLYKMYTFRLKQMITVLN